MRCGSRCPPYPSAYVAASAPGRQCFDGDVTEKVARMLTGSRTKYSAFAGYRSPSRDDGSGDPAEGNTQANNLGLNRPHPVVNQIRSQGNSALGVSHAEPSRSCRIAQCARHGDEWWRMHSHLANVLEAAPWHFPTVRWPATAVMFDHEARSAPACSSRDGLSKYYMKA